MSPPAAAGSLTDEERIPMPTDHPTLARFLAGERRHPPVPGADPAPLILDVALACRAIAGHAARGALLDPPHDAGRKLAAIAADCFAHATGGSSNEQVAPQVHPHGDHLLAVVPLDGASDVDVNGPVGSIFSILPAAGGVLRPGTAQVCAGYALYGPATTLVLTLARGVHAFTLDPALGEFVLTRESVRVPPTSPNRPFAQLTAPSLVARTQRVLARGGGFRCADDAAHPAGPRLIHEANPLAFLVEQAGGIASTGRERVLDVVPTDLHQRTPLVLGARAAPTDHRYDSPLYGARGLFRAGAG
jgi:fructose-1,6-bisphosphatase I / sedoheptulose-1,7-bisphosphatase